MTVRRPPAGTASDAMAGDRSRAASVLVEQVFARASGARLVDGNDVRLLREMYLDDLENATEITLTRRARLAQTAAAPRLAGRRSGSVGRAAAGAVSVGSAVGAAMTARRVLGPAEARIMAMAGIALLVLALLAAVWPRVIAVPLAAIAMWLAVTLLVRAWILHRERIRNFRATTDAPEDSTQDGAP